MKLLIVLSFLFVATAFAEKDRFDNYRVHTVWPKTAEQLKALKELEATDEYNFWSAVRLGNASVDIMVPPHKRSDFRSFIEEFNLEQNIKIENVQSVIDDQESLLKTRPRSMDWTNYHTLKEIYDWLDDLAKKYPKIVKVVTGGITYEGRPIKGIEINFGTNLTGVFIESGIHSREWISPATTTWIINEMLKGKLDPVFKQFNYLYFPIFNPDGYVYTWTTNRMWRKTRTPYPNSFGKTCYGADPNRNWDCHWNEIGTSQNPCSETYSGPKAFSEMETKSMSQYLTKVSKKRKQDIFFSFHSYSQLLMFPWGYTTKPSDNDEIFHRVAAAAVKDLTAVYGTKYTYGTIAETIYETSGTTIEWYYQEFNGTLDFVYELRDLGTHGFLLPPEQILPSAIETTASLRRILLEYKKIKNY